MLWTSYRWYQFLSLYAQSHDRVDYVVVILFQRLDRLVAGDAGLGHDELDVLVLKTFGVDLLLIVLLILLGVRGVDSLALAVVVRMGRVVVTGVVVLLSRRQLLGSCSLSLGVQVLNLSLTEDAIALVSQSSVTPLSIDWLTCRCCC